MGNITHVFVFCWIPFLLALNWKRCNQEEWRKDKCLQFDLSGQLILPLFFLYISYLIFLSTSIITWRKGWLLPSVFVWQAVTSTEPENHTEWRTGYFFLFFASIATATYCQWPPHCHYSLPSEQQLTGLTLFISQRHPWKTKTENETSPAAWPASPPLPCLVQPAQTVFAKSLQSLSGCRAHLKQVPSSMASRVFVHNQASRMESIWWDRLEKT